MNDHEVRLAAVAFTEVLLLRARYCQYILGAEQVDAAGLIDDREEEVQAALVLFDPAAYLELYPDVDEAGLDPAMHYLRYGWRENRFANLFFSPAWYRATYADVDGATVEPLDHFVRHGEAEGRRPNPYFSPAYYLRTFGDVADSGMSPFAHFIRAGAAEGRLPSARLARFTPALQGLLDARQVIAATMIADDALAVRVAGTMPYPQDGALPRQFVELLDYHLPEIRLAGNAFLRSFLSAADNGRRELLVATLNGLAHRLLTEVDL